MGVRDDCRVLGSRHGCAGSTRGKSVCDPIHSRVSGLLLIGEENHMETSKYSKRSQNSLLGPEIVSKIFSTLEAAS